MRRAVIIELRGGGAACFLLSMAVLGALRPASACQLDAAFGDLGFAEGFEATEHQSGWDDRHALLVHIVQRAGTLTNEWGETLLPQGTTLDVLHFDERNTLHVRLTIPAVGPWPLDELRAETIDRVLSIPFMEDPTYAGVVTQIRIGPDGEYRLLGEHLPEPTADDWAPELDVREVAVREPMDLEADSWELGPHSIGGPIANADGQPTGALSGVVVFVNAGHGWTAGSSSWLLQRPLLLNMNEDYGNLDQMEYFVHYLYNAGATVVPFRPVGYQPIEIVLDNDDPGVTWSGPWNNSLATTEYYEDGKTLSGIPYRWASTNASTETAVARYAPNIPVTDFYPVYCWTRDGSDRADQLYRIRHSGGTAEVRVDHRRVGKGWIWLGSYHFEAGTGGYVEISNLAPSGVVIADAIRFGNGMGDIIRPGPGTVSGYPREEEAARYWAHSEAGNNAVGLPTSIYDQGRADQTDNVGTAARWARQMNRENFNDDRWRRVYLEWHSNAAGCSGGPPCGAKGTVCLAHSSSPTTNQFTFAKVLCDKIEQDMKAVDHQFEYSWGTRNNPGSGSFGAISTLNNSNQFDATIIEVAFHDNVEDAANLRNAKVRDAVARSSLQGLIMFLSNPNTFPGTQVPNVFLPEPPERLRVTHDGNGDVVLSWIPGPARPAFPATGDPATGYKIYRSSNGYGFGQAVDVGNVLSATLTDVPADTTVYFRVTAYNAGGESMPTETLAVRRPASGPTFVLIVNGYDRVSRHQNHIQQIPSRGPMERPIHRIVNSFDYIVQHAQALDPIGLHFDSSSNEAVIAGTVSLNNYAAVIWILGRESQADKTFDSIEQTLVTNYLNAGGGLFVSGTDIGFDLDGMGAGQSFYRNVLRGLYAGDDANTFNVIGAGGSMTGLPQFSFSVAAGAPYRAVFPDQVNPNTGAASILSYVAGAGGGAGIEYDSGTYRTVMFGFPFETIGLPGVREDVMARVMNFLLPDGVGCLTATLANFEGYPIGTQVMFRQPTFSGSTNQHLAASPNSAVVTDEAAFDGFRSNKVQWRWLDASPSRWLRLTTSGTASIPNPAIDLRRAVRVRLRLDSGQFRLALGIRETGVDVPIGANGGTTGTIEWVGATHTIGNAPQGVLVDAEPGVWQTITFIPRPDNVLPFTGDGVLEAPNRMGVLEHLAFAVTNDAGPFTVYLDAIQQPCPPRADLDDDGDVDQDDFAILQRCFTGPFVPQNDPDCLRARLDGDSDVDQDDFLILFNCISGPGIPADPDCEG